MSATTRDVDDGLKTLVDRGTISIVLGGFALFGPGADSLCRTKNFYEILKVIGGDSLFGSQLPLGITGGAGSQPLSLRCLGPCAVLAAY